MRRERRIKSLGRGREKKKIKKIKKNKKKFFLKTNLKVHRKKSKNNHFSLSKK
jgi:hypothetical protein